MRSREPGGNRYSRLWRYAALSGPDGVVVDSFNGWNEGTQIEPAEAAGCGGGGESGGSGGEKSKERNKGSGKASSSPSSSSSAATALGPQCAPDVRSYAEEGAGPFPSLSSSRGSRKNGRESGGSKSQRQQQQQQVSHLYMRLTASEAARAAAVAVMTRGARGYEPPRALPSQLQRGGGGQDERRETKLFRRNKNEKKMKGLFCLCM